MVVAVAGSGLTKVRATPEGQRVAAVLRALRRDQGLTQQDVADAWGITVDGYRPWERGERARFPTRGLLPRSGIPGSSPGEDTVTMPS